MAALDPFDLARFLLAQEETYATALAELEAGRKDGHYSWFVFPQLRGLGVSPTSLHFSIGSLAEAQAYLDHDVLGPRLLACTNAVLRHRGTALRAILGSPDDIKFRSSMTLFAEAADDPLPFREALDAFCGGTPDPRTLAMLAPEAGH